MHATVATATWCTIKWATIGKQRQRSSRLLSSLRTIRMCIFLLERFTRTNSAITQNQSKHSAGIFNWAEPTRERERLSVKRIKRPPPLLTPRRNAFPVPESVFFPTNLASGRTSLEPSAVETPQWCTKRSNVRQEHEPDVPACVYVRRTSAYPGSV